MYGVGEKAYDVGAGAVSAVQGAGQKTYDVMYQGGEMLTEGVLNFNAGLQTFLKDGLSMMSQGAKNIGSAAGITYGPQSPVGNAGISEDNLARNSNSTVNVGGAITINAAPDQNTQATIEGLRAAQGQLENQVRKLQNQQGGVPQPPKAVPQGPGRSVVSTPSA